MSDPAAASTSGLKTEEITEAAEEESHSMYFFEEKEENPSEFSKLVKEIEHDQNCISLVIYDLPEWYLHIDDILERSRSIKTNIDALETLEEGSDRSRMSQISGLKTNLRNSLNTLRLNMEGFWERNRWRRMLWYKEEKELLNLLYELGYRPAIGEELPNDPEENTAVPTRNSESGGNDPEGYSNGKERGRRNRTCRNRWFWYWILALVLIAIAAGTILGFTLW